MNTIFKEIDDQTLDEFVFSHPKEHFMQTAEWGKIKSMQGAWTYQCVGLFEDDTLIVTHRGVINMLYYIFGFKDSVDTIGTTDSPEKEMLRSLIIAVAHMIYLSYGFEKIKEVQK